MAEYQQVQGGNDEFLSNHTQLLQSLLTSRQNVSHQPYTENTQGIGNDAVESSQGIN